MLAVCVAAFAAGLSISKRLPRRAATLFALLNLLSIGLFLQFAWDAPLLIKLIPLRNVIVLANFQPPLTAMLAGLAWGLIKGTHVRRSLFIVPLITISLWRGYGRLFEAPPAVRAERWKGEVCRQTSNATCTAAAATTLLRAYGISTTESEMAQLSLTRADGTTVHGRYRGLVLKTLGTRWKVEPIVNADLASLRELATSPLILSVGLPRGADGTVDPRYIDKYGWLPGMRHTVVLFGFTPEGKLDIGDPSTGREQWDIADLKVLWQGNGFRLIPR